MQALNASSTLNLKAMTGATLKVHVSYTDRKDDNTSIVSSPFNSIPPVCTTDITSRYAVPRTLADWNSLLLGTGLASPTEGWDGTRLATGDLVGYIGGMVLSAVNAPTYQQSITGWKSKGITGGDGLGVRFRANAGIGPDPNTTSQIWGCTFNAAWAVGANRAIFGINMASSVNSARALYLTSGLIRLNYIGSNIDGFVTHPNGDYVMFLQYDRNVNVIRVQTDLEMIAGTYSSTGLTDTEKGFGSAGYPGGVTFTSMWLWSGATAETFDNAKLNTVRSRIKNTTHTILSSPASGFKRSIRNVTITNTDSALHQTFDLEVNDSGVSSPMHGCKNLTLAPGDYVVIDHKGKTHFSELGDRNYDVQIFDTPGSYIWEKPSWFTAKNHRVECTGGGGGGGGGGSNTTTTARMGGAGGGGGGFHCRQFTDADLAATELVVVGARGTAGAAGASGGSGGDGGTGGASSFGSAPYVQGGGGGPGRLGANSGTAGGGGGGGGYTNGATGTAGAGGNGGTPGTASLTAAGMLGGTGGFAATAAGTAEYGGGGGGGHTAVPAVGAGGTSVYGGGGGGCGGGVTAVPGVISPSAGGAAGKHDVLGGGGGAAGVSGAAPTAGANGADGSSLRGGHGGGGGGSSATANTAGAAGGSGGYPGGAGGGGGAGTNTSGGGIGGMGGRGRVAVYSW